jgi:hypothetical protein
LVDLLRDSLFNSRLRLGNHISCSIAKSHSKTVSRTNYVSYELVDLLRDRRQSFQFRIAIGQSHLVLDRQAAVKSCVSYELVDLLRDRRQPF